MAGLFKLSQVYPPGSESATGHFLCPDTTDNGDYRSYDGGLLVHLS